VKKLILIQIEVPEGKYCAGPAPDYEICEHFDNEGGHSTCDMRMGRLEDSEDGVLKPKKCLAGKTWQ